MKVLTLSTIYPNEQNDSIGRSVAFLDRALAKRGVQGATLFLRPWAPGFLARRLAPWRHLALRNRLEQEDGLTVVFDQYLHLPRRTRLDLSARFMARQACRIIERRGWKFEIIHGQSICPSALAAYLLSQRYQVPFIITLRDDLSHLDNIIRNGSPALRKLYKAMFERVHAIFAHGPAILRDVPRFLQGKRSTPTLMVPNGVDIVGIGQILETLPLEWKRSWGHIVSVGNLYRFKGIHENLQALRILDDRGFRTWHYTVVGSGPYQRELETIATELGLGDRVKFVGGVTHSEAIRYIRDSDIFCLPSWGEPFGNVYAEAAVCGRPAIGCRGYGAEVIIRDEETGLLVPPKDANALSYALEYLLRHPERAHEMGKVAKQHVRQFTWERTAELYQESIRNILSSQIAIGNQREEGTGS